MGRLFTLAALTIAFLAGGAIAQAYYGWRQVSTPCTPTGIAMSGATIAIICPGDQHVYVQER
jgi:hypothetical protein